MDGVSAESNALFIAFRRLVYSFSEQVSREECQAIIYIRLYPSKERYKDASTLEVLSKLEADGMFGPSNPQGLLEITKDIRRQDLANEVKEFIKKRSKSERKSSVSSGGKKGAARQSFHSQEQYEDTEEDLQLRATIEVTLTQATVLMQQVEILERAVAGGKAQRQRAKEAIAEAGQTATALADRLRKAQEVLGLGVGEEKAAESLPLSVPGRSASTDAEDQQPFYSSITYPGDALGTISHSAPVGVAGQYALQPLLSKETRQLDRIPEQSTSETTKDATEEEEEDDYEKMVSFVGHEEEVQKWRMSLITQGSSYGSFAPSVHHPRSSVQFSSSGHASRNNPPPVLRSQTEHSLRPLSYSPGSFQYPPPTSAAGRFAKQGSSSSISQSCGAATKAQATYSTRPQPQHNVNSNNSSGNTTPPTSHPTRMKAYQWSGEHSKASQKVLHQRTTIEKYNDDGATDAKRATHRPPPPVPWAETCQQVTSKSTPESLSTHHHQRGNLAVSKNNIRGQQDNGDEELNSVGTEKGDKESNKTNLVKARLENLEKLSTSRKPALSPKPNSRPVAKPRKHTSRSNTLSHGSSLAAKDQHKTKTLPHLSSSSKQFGPSQPSSASQGEDDAYTTLHPSGTSGSTVNTGDSGFEDVRPLQRLDQEPVHEDVATGPAAPPPSDAYTSLLNQRNTTFDQDGYSKVNYRSTHPT